MAMKDARTAKPTEGELELLQILWKQGPSTVREVHGHMDGNRHVGYTTVLKLLQIMHRKGLVRRQDDERAHIYMPAAPESESKARLVTDLIDRAFDGSSAALMLYAIQSKPTSPGELAELRKELERLEREGQP